MGYEKKISVEIGGELAEHVAASVGDRRLYVTASDYVHDLIRRDMERERGGSDAYKAELEAAFAVSDEEARPFDAEGFRARMAQRHG